MEKLVKIAEAQGGFVTAGDVTKAGIPRRCLAEAVRQGALARVDRGLYALPDTWEDEYLVAQHRFARGIFSHETALFLHGLTDRTPEALMMTFPHGYNTTAARRAGIVAKTVEPALIGLGKAVCLTPYGNKVAVYDVERTLCDIVRGQAEPDVQLVNPAMRAYALSRDKDVDLLVGYASQLGVKRKVRTYLGVLL